MNKLANTFDLRMVRFGCKFTLGSLKVMMFLSLSKDGFESDDDMVVDSSFSASAIDCIIYLLRSVDSLELR